MGVSRGVDGRARDNALLDGRVRVRDERAAKNHLWIGLGDDPLGRFVSAECPDL